MARSIRGDLGSIREPSHHTILGFSGNMGYRGRKHWLRFY
jgi:hypothetical protein